MARKSRGRQKIQMKRMSKESNLLVTFSKRRSGLFKKASELCTLCAAEIAIIVFSPGKKVFSFGHPSVDSVVDRYLDLQGQAAQPPKPAALQLVEAHRSAGIRELNLQLNELLGAVEAERGRAEELSRLREKSGGGGEGRWWEAPVKEMGMGELEQLREAMEDLRMNVFRQVEKMMILMPPPFVAVEAGGGAGQLPMGLQGFTIGFGPSLF
ncbi:agamous-like MADS-box protein AGL62 [Andrographis paniculata]|uniref:agamous-like MADS-box protein AGL62 n=1 Tax=Andrographis paniculata TaxID=175694 RepID=UPI0021E8EB12|nr:agamous-like MADS-box protein AGL62 [Andrographis paniculata]